MSDYELIKKTMRILASKELSSLSLDEGTTQLVSEIACLENKLDNHIDEHADDILEVIQQSSITNLLVHVSYENEFLSIFNSIFEFADLYFFHGTDLEMRGPYNTFADACAHSEELFVPREDGYVSVFVRSDLSKFCLTQLISAYADCEITLSNENGELKISSLDLKSVEHGEE